MHPTENGLQRALQFFQAGNPKKAESLCRKTLKKSPKNPDALLLLGMISNQTGRPDKAVEYIHKAIINKPNDPSLHFNLGYVQCQAKQFQQAIGCFETAIQLNAGYTQAYLGLASCHQALGHSDELLHTCKRGLSIEPNNPEFYFLMGTQYGSNGDIHKAEECFRKIVGLNPESAPALQNLAIIEMQQGKLESAYEHYHMAIRIDPQNTEYHNNLGALHHKQGKFNDAFSCYHKVLGIDPGNVNAIINIGIIHQETGDLSSAETAYCKALGLNQEHDETLLKLSQLKNAQEQPEAAEQYLRKILDRHPTHGNALLQMSDLHRNKGDHENAITCCDMVIDTPNTNDNLDVARALNMKATLALDYANPRLAEDYIQTALELIPDMPDALWNRSLAMLMQGQYSTGWDLYNYRLIKNSPIKPLLPGNKPVWDGTSLNKGILWIGCEQGVGDELMFATCLKDIPINLNRCVLSCDQRFKHLFSRSFPELTVIGHLDSEDYFHAHKKNITHQVAAGSLPRYFRRNIEDFPEKTSYLTPDPELIDLWHDRLHSVGGNNLKVGISWKGGTTTLSKNIRSVELVKWHSVLSLPHIEFINLQYDKLPGDVDQLENALNITLHDWKDVNPLSDLDNFCACIANLDLIITIDNSTAHFGGVLGTPTWVLLSATPDWRWTLEGEQTPWYHSLKLFRQHQPGDWDQVLQRVRDELLVLSSTTR